MSIQKLRPTFTFDQDRIERLKAIAPEAFADGKINWDVLKQALGEYLEDESSTVEHFGLFWPGKREARRFASKPSSGTLIPAEGEGVDEENTHNIFIEGDNLEVLKLLQKSYAGQVKMIYIDPPYNTGNDFVYSDNFTESLDVYLELSGQRGQTGELLTTNTRADGRFHSNWLNMIYPRLRLARTLLREDGVIFVSIDDNENYHLRMVMNEIFGEENFRAEISWQKKYSVSNNYKGIASIRDLILVYSRSESFANGLLPRTEESLGRYLNPDNDARGPWKAVDYWNQASPDARPNLVYPIANPNNGKVILPTKKAWKFSKEVYERHAAENRLWWGKDGSNTVPALKLFLTDVKDGLIPHDWWPHEDAGHTDEAKKELQDLFDGAAPFDTPKPTRLIKRIMRVANVQKDDIVMDFFAGSGTTAHAVLQQNIEQSSENRFVLIQIPEPVTNPAFPTLSEIGKERIRRVSRKLKAEGAIGDLGFRVYKLAPSSFKQWHNYDGQDIAALEQQFAQFETPLVDGWTKENLLTEIILQQGFPLDSIITPQKEFAKNEIVVVSSPASAHKLFVCLDEKIHDATVKELKLAKRDVFICLDSALSSEAKVRLGDTTNLVVI